MDKQNAQNLGKNKLNIENFDRELIYMLEDCGLNNLIKFSLQNYIAIFSYTVRNLIEENAKETTKNN